MFLLYSLLQTVQLRCKSLSSAIIIIIITAVSLLLLLLIIIIRQFVRRRNMSVDTTRAHYRKNGNAVRNSSTETTS